MSVRGYPAANSRKLEKTGTPGVFKRGGRYVVIVRGPNGRPKKHAAQTLAEARALKASLTTDIARGEYREQSKATFVDYAPEWVATYAGRTTRGFREQTRKEYLRDLGFDRAGKPVDRAAKFFGQMRLAEIEPRHVKQYLSELADNGLSATTIRRLRAPLRALLATAAEDGMIRFNPAAGVRVPAHAKQPEQKRKNLLAEERQALREQLTDEEELLLVDFLLATGLRVSELMALDWQDLDHNEKRVHVHRRLYHGLDAPKSRHSNRQVRISEAMAMRLQTLRDQRTCATADTDPIFATKAGARHNYANLYNRVVRPAMRAAGIEDGAFHRLRHTTGTELRRRGVAADAIQLHLGHHDPAFTARVYVHLDPTDGPDPNLLDDVAGCTPANVVPLKRRAVGGN